MNVTALIPAAGIGNRFSKFQNKLLYNVKGKTILEHTVYAFDNIFYIKEIIIVTQKDCFSIVENLFKGKLKSNLKIVEGGKERQDSVRHGLRVVTNPYVLIHDAARPFVSEEIIINSIKALESNNAVLVATPAIDTIKVAVEDFVIDTPDRKTLWHAQTPQGFRTDLILSLHEKAKEANIFLTDDAGICEWAKVPVKIIKGDYKNIKITTQSDIDLLKTFLGVNMNRIGQGYDVHKLCPNRKLILGGVTIPFEMGLLGHSDADVLLHAITDAIFGACALGDLGKHFPPSNDKYKDIDSMILLQKAYNLAKEKGVVVSNIDSTIVAQKPKLSPYIDQMRENIAKAMDIDINQVSVKATTTEKLGFEGRGEGISAQAVVIMHNA
ncbi:MAG: 2-C-methyl-D-erythritol 2,4-cyclodiphosphate synthase [Abditibacteriota bacterium]|nr:2-C-methyl-D-erythritol 2,4-cyclodiphosphate synthase [Abditibacteriota bacterium]